jgi:hypothetical protein
MPCMTIGVPSHIVVVNARSTLCYWHVKRFLRTARRSSMSFKADAGRHEKGSERANLAWFAPDSGRCADVRDRQPCADGDNSTSIRAQLILGYGELLFAIARIRAGFKAIKAKAAAMILSADATTNTAVQLPVAVASTLANGTNRAATPLVV